MQRCHTAKDRELPDTALSALPLEPVPSTTDQVFRTLYAAVISLRLPPGTKVSEAEIAKQLDVSRQPVRDAFFRLSKLGFLSIRPQRATLVTRISTRAVHDAIFVRGALEAECVEATCHRHSAADLAELRTLLDREKAAIGSSNPEDFHAEDDAFHQALCRIAGHAHVWEIIQEQKAHMDRVRYLTLSTERRISVLAEHGEILTAVEARDGTAARALVRAHISSVASALDAIRAEHPDRFEDH